MFGLGMTIAAFLGSTDKTGLKPTALSPVTSFLEKFGQGWTKDLSDFKLPVPADEFEEAMKVLHRPEAVIVARYGGHMVNPEESRFAVAGSGAGMRLVVIESMPPAGLFIQYFDSLATWAEWVLDRLDPMRIARERKGLIPTDKLDWEELLHFLHLADMYRSCYYQSMLDHVPLDEFVFSKTQYIEDLHDAILSVDWRWLVPCLMSMIPGAVPDSVLGLTDRMECLRRFGLITDSDSGLLKFTDAGQELGTEFMLQWVSALGLEVSFGVGKGAGEGRLFALGTNSGTHLFGFEKQGPNAEINYRIVGEPGVMESLKKFMSGIKAAASVPIQPATVGRFCTQCGKKLEAGSKFCPSCGAKV
jgi:zinc-ribbon domain